MKIIGYVLLAIPAGLLLAVDYWAHWKFWLVFDLCFVAGIFALERLIAWDVRRQGF